MNKQEFLKAITYMGILFNKDISRDIVETWYEFFIDIPETIFKNAIKELAKETKYLPSLQELLDKCSIVKTNEINYVVQQMYDDGYFKRGTYGELSDDQAFRNYEKTLMWVEKGIIPEWLREDMQEYIDKERQTKLTTNERLQIKC
jgi:hypothetical protein